VRGGPELPPSIAGAVHWAQFDQQVATQAEDYLEALVRAGRWAEAIVETEASQADAGLREHLTLLRAIAPAQAGRFVEPLRVVADLRRDLGASGLEPGDAVPPVGCRSWPEWPALGWPPRFTIPIWRGCGMRGHQQRFGPTRPQVNAGRPVEVRALIMLKLVVRFYLAPQNPCRRHFLP
jgi:Bacterial transcriptional activator domain